MFDKSPKNIRTISDIIIETIMDSDLAPVVRSLFEMTNLFLKERMNGIFLLRNENNFVRRWIRKFYLNSINVSFVR